MLYKASFQKLSYLLDGLYVAYDLSSDEKASLMSRFSKTTSLDSNYLIFDSVNDRIFVELFIHDYWIPKKFDIKNDIVDLLGRGISESETKKVSNFLASQALVLYVDYNITNNTWALSEKSKLELLSKIREGVL